MSASRRRVARVRRRSRRQEERVWRISVAMGLWDGSFKEWLCRPNPPYECRIVSWRWMTTEEPGYNHRITLEEAS